MQINIKLKYKDEFISAEKLIHNPDIELEDDDSITLVVRDDDFCFDKELAALFKVNQKLRKRNSNLAFALTEIQKSLVCIGGPLNDNVLGFNDKQLRWINDRIHNVINIANPDKEAADETQ